MEYSQLASTEVSNAYDTVGLVLSMAIFQASLKEEFKKKMEWEAHLYKMLGV